MIDKTYPWILIDKADMGGLRHRFHNTESVAFAMLKSGTLLYRNFSEFLIIKNEKTIVDLSKAMRGFGGDIASIHREVLEVLENA